MGRPSREGWVAGQHLIQHAPDGVEVGPHIHRASGRLLGTHVCRRTHGEPGHRQLFSIERECLGHAEVSHPGLRLAEQNVLGLEIPVHDSFPVGVVEGRCNLAGDLQRQLDGQLALASQPVAQGLAPHVGHRIPELTCGRAGVENGEDVRVIQAGGQADLALEAFRSERRRQLGVEQLERYRAIVAQVAREVDGRHSAAPKLALDEVSIGQRRFKAIQDIGHEAESIRYGSQC